MAPWLSVPCCRKRSDDPSLRFLQQGTESQGATGDLNRSRPQAILDLIPLYRSAPEGFLARDARPAPLRASILGRLPPLGSAGNLVEPLAAFSKEETEETKDP